MQDAYLKRIRDIIAAERWAVQAVAAEPPFAYTVGLTELGLPELVVAGLPPAICMGLLNCLAAQVVDDGLCLEEGALVERVAQSVPVRVHAVDPDVARQVVRVAGALYGEVPAWQMLWPDGEGRFEGDAGFDSQYQGRQRLLQPDQLC